MILGDISIEAYLGQEKGVIGYKPENINPNSVDLTLNPTIKIYQKSGLFNAFKRFLGIKEVLDCRKKNEVKEIVIPESGFVLRPNTVYLMSVNERLRVVSFDKIKQLCSIGTAISTSVNICAKVEGKSSIGRLGCSIHQTAGWIDSGFEGDLVLELAVLQPLRIYPNQKICQIAFHESTEVKTNYGQKEGSKYQNQVGAQESKMHENFK